MQKGATATGASGVTHKQFENLLTGEYPKNDKAPYERLAGVPPDLSPHRDTISYN